MSKSQDEFNLALEILNNSKTEELILDNLTKIIKGFDVSMYKDIINSNPYYKSLIEDVKVIILEEIEYLKKNIEEEIETIDVGIKSGNGIELLEQLRSECLIYLSEINKRKKEVEEL